MPPTPQHGIVYRGKRYCDMRKHSDIDICLGLWANLKKRELLWGYDRHMRLGQE